LTVPGGTRNSGGFPSGGFSKPGKSIANTSGGVPASTSSGMSVFRGTLVSAAPHHAASPVMITQVAVIRSMFVPPFAFASYFARSSFSV